MPSFTSARFMGRLAVGLCGLAATAAIASDREVVVSSPEGVTRTVVVKTADLNLASANGQARLGWRIEQASRTACNMFRGSDIDKLPSAKACLVQARATAIAALEARGITPTHALAVN